LTAVDVNGKRYGHKNIATDDDSIYEGFDCQPAAFHGRRMSDAKARRKPVDMVPIL
jgi:hypothetical protein